MNKFEYNLNVLIDDSLYSKTSLKDDVEKISDMSNKISVNNIVNIAVKYLHAYRHPSTFDVSLKLGDIRESISVLDWFAEVCYPVKFQYPQENIVEIIEEDYSLEFEWFKKNEYAYRMLRDISSTVKIFSDIADREITNSLWSKKFRWLDLWSWSGILSLAQTIQARRNWFSEIDVIWIEYFDEQVNAANEILWLLNAWSIIQWDLRKSEIYHILGENEDKIQSIILELLPRGYISMADRNSRDPFYKCISNLRKYIPHLLTVDTNAFPSQIELQVAYSISPEILIWSLDNRYEFDELLKIEQAVEWILHWDENILDRTYVKRIKIGEDDFIHLDEIWDDILEAGMVIWWEWVTGRWKNEV